MEADLTAMLNAWSAGDSDAREHLASIIYNELHHLARLRMFGERPGHMLNSSALVNEAFVRFMESSPRKWEDRVHFFAFMSRVMRQVLFDLARYRNAAKRSSEHGNSGIEEAENVPVHPNFHMFLDLDIRPAWSNCDTSAVWKITRSPRSSQFPKIRFCVIGVSPAAGFINGLTLPPPLKARTPAVSSSAALASAPEYRTFVSYPSCFPHVQSQMSTLFELLAHFLSVTMLSCACSSRPMQCASGSGPW
jgi:hypothetical protein